MFLHFHLRLEYNCFLFKCYFVTRGEEKTGWTFFNLTSRTGFENKWEGREVNDGNTILVDYYYYYYFARTQMAFRLWGKPSGKKMMRKKMRIFVLCLCSSSSFGAMKFILRPFCITSSKWTQKNNGVEGEFSNRRKKKKKRRTEARKLTKQMR